MKAVQPALATKTSPGTGLGLFWVLRESWQRSRALTVLGLVMWITMLPTLIAWGLDERTLREVNVWAKPLKFMASIGLFALCTAWFIGLLPAARRNDLAVRMVVWTIIIAGLAEIIYITLMAALGQPSHYNFTSPLYITLYSLMGLGAMAMTATQPLLAWHIARHGSTDLSPAWRDAVVLGLVLTFVLGASAGGLLGSMQPPAGTGLPVVGWHASGDLRPAHFIGMHAQQFFPLAGACVAAWMPQKGRRGIAVFGVCYAALWVWAVARGLEGAILTVPYMPAG